jgi:class 3 adenylate cyclase
MINETILEQKIDALKSFPVLKNEHIQIFKEAILKEDDWGLIHINPIQFSKKYSIPSSDGVNLFIHSSKIGLMDMSYQMVCPRCGGYAFSHNSLDTIQPDEFFCSVCYIKNQSNLDDMVEVTFSIHMSIKTLQINPLGNFNDYFKFYFSPNYIKSKELLDFISTRMRNFIVIDADQTLDIEFDSSINPVFQLICIEKNSSAMLYFKNQGQDIQEIDILPKGFNPDKVEISSHKKSIKLKNRTKEKLGIIENYPNPDKIIEIVKAHPTKIENFLTGKMLLNNQSFRDLYRIQNLSKEMNLNIKSLTVMFTDLRGSTEMYDKAGDILAYQLVQEHFQILIESVRKYSGSVVKTMGDAIMATFSNPVEGLLTSLEMMNKINELNEKWKSKGYQIGLKVGLHEGSALAVVNDERLDYFGQTVNIAARVQGLASAGEIWLSDSVFNSLGIQNELEKNDYSFEKSKATLKGVGEKAIVYKCYPSEVK